MTTTSRAMSDWQPIATKHPPSFADGGKNCWIIGYVMVGLNAWVGPCEWQGEKCGWQFANTDFGAFPGPTHWTPFPDPPEVSNP